VAVAGIWLITRRRASSLTGVLGAAGLTALLLVIVSQSSWQNQLRRVDNQRAVLPPHLDFVDRATDERTGLVNEGQTSTFNILAGRRLAAPDYEVEFFNRRIKDFYYSRYALIGSEAARVCPYTIADDGAATSSGPNCPQPPRTLLYLEGIFASTLRNEHVLSTFQRQGWRLVQVPRAPARVLAIVRSPCNAATCTGDLRVNTWLDQPGAVIVTFTDVGGGASQISYASPQGTRVATLPPNGRRTIREAVSRGPQAVQMLVQGTGTFPDVTIRVREGAKVTRVF
jgi:hypothetical protein